MHIIISDAVSNMMQVLVHFLLELLIQFFRLGHQLLEVRVLLVQGLPIVFCQLVVQFKAQVLISLLSQLLMVFL